MRSPILVVISALLVTAVAPGCSSDGGGDTDTSVVDTNTPVDTSGDTGTPADTAQDTVETDTVPGDTLPADTSPGDTADTTPTGAVVVVNELFTTGSDDWIELTNAGSEAAALAGWTLSDSDPTHVYAFPEGTVLAPGVYLLVERGGDTGFDFGLGDADAVLLRDAGGGLVDSLSWVDGEIPSGFSFGRFPNGTGTFGVRFVATPGAANLENEEVVCPDGVRGGLEVCDGDDLDGQTCAALGYASGTLACDTDCMGFDTSGCVALPPALVVNEVTSTGDDRIELFNGTSAAVALDGWYVGDDNDNRYVFPTGTTIAAGAYLVLTKGVEHDFGLGADDRVDLVDASGTVVDSADWGPNEADISWCRIPNGVGGFRSCAVQSFGNPND
ncbi:MAG: lamin tail domain-containing protein [Myxococcales bacterium]|nr:lamin tail domain-containing protein [Myxococcales bacterium]